jgi:hypothetical protein
MKAFKQAFVTLCAAAGLAACAGSVAQPVSVQALSQDKVRAIHISEVTTETAPGVTMKKEELDRIRVGTRSHLASETQVVVDPKSPEAASALKMKLVFTQYDKGDPVARLILIGLGQIKIDADVVLTDAGGNVVGKYRVSKDFAFGGIVGGLTKPEDVEEGFEESVVEIFKAKMM